MKALTICQPSPYLIVTPAEELPAGQVPKRVENRIWSTNYRGPLLIHSGLSTEWLEDDHLKWPLQFGVIVGCAEVFDCIEISRKRGKVVVADSVSAKYPWLKDDPHATGPYALILSRVYRFREAIPAKGAQRFFDISEELIADALANAEPIADPFESPFSTFASAESWRQRLAAMSEPEFAQQITMHCAKDSFVAGLYRSGGRKSALSALASVLAKKEQPVGQN